MEINYTGASSDGTEIKFKAEIPAAGQTVEYTVKKISQSGKISRLFQNLFDDPAMAEGYASARPPVHSRVIERDSPAREAALRVRFDVGCGATFPPCSTRFGAYCFWHRSRRMHALARKESTPLLPPFSSRAQRFRSLPESPRFISAAGALNYTNLSAFFSEASRILRPRSLIVVYDFSPGRTFPNDRSLSEWFNQFSRRFSRLFMATCSQPGLALADPRFAMESHEYFSIALPMTHAQYRDYMLTETNVAQAV